ncbi:MAG TPA: SGNH/GDSL hydrolase family protein [Xanthobacteraceae bacterium]|nr:SGNH/GDSL hydrolase family protein [Xanthobacteraceae bacterium]
MNAVAASRPRARRALLCAVALGVVNLVDPVAADQRETADRLATLLNSGLDQTLTRTRFQLLHGRTLTIVAIGSSSTEGAGASSQGAAYPARLQALLGERFPGVAIRVLNRGIGGEEEIDMLARFERDVIAEKPDLVLWQVASNAIMRDRDLATEQTLIREGLARLKQSGADTVLIDPQYTPAVLAHAVVLPMVDLIAAEGRRQQVGTFHRFALMRDWHDKQRIPFEMFSIADGLHMNDWGYDCLARNLAVAIIESARYPAVASTAATGSRAAFEAGAPLQ